MESRVNNKYSHLPAGWEVKTVEQVFDFYPTASYSRDKMFKDNNPSAIGYIHYGDIHTKYNLILDVPNTEIPYISEELKKDFEYIKEGDLILSDTSEDYDGVGKCIEILNVGSNKIISGLHTLMLRPKGNDLIDGFKGYLFSGEYVRNSLLRIVTGIKVYSIAKAMLAKVNLPIPSIQEQKEITSVLSKVDKAIASVQNSIAAAERLKKSLMQNLLTGRMKPDGTLRKEDEFYVDEKFGKVPLGWEVKRLKDICLNSGDYGANASAIDYDETKPRFIRITDIDDFGQLLDEGKASMAGDNTTKYMLEEDDFLFARTGDTVGKSLLYKKEMGPAVYAGYLIKFTFDRNLVLPDYFDLIAKSEFFEAFKIAMKRVGAKPNINSREYCSFKFLLPSDTMEQKEIYGKFANIDKSQKAKQEKITVLEKLKKSLMQNLLTGKVKIK